MQQGSWLTGSNIFHLRKSDGCSAVSGNPICCDLRPSPRPGSAAFLVAKRLIFSTKRLLEFFPVTGLGQRTFRFTPSFSQVMRSIASQWRHEDTREPLVADQMSELHGDSAAAEEEFDFADLTQRMREALTGDRPALGPFDQILTQTSRKQACEQLGLDATGYDTARRRMTRIA